MRGDAAKPNKIGRAVAVSSDTVKSVKLIRSKFVALDSSHLIDIVRDTFSNDGARREKAAAFGRAFEGSGSVLLLSWHHLQELLSHENEAVIEQRFEYFAYKTTGWLPQIAYGRVGSRLDHRYAGHGSSRSVQKPRVHTEWSPRRCGCGNVYARYRARHRPAILGIVVAGFGGVCLALNWPA